MWPRPAARRAMARRGPRRVPRPATGRRAPGAARPGARAAAREGARRPAPARAAHAADRARAPISRTRPRGTTAGPVADGLRADADFARLLAIRDIGTWTVEVLALNGLGRLDVVPAGDLNYLKLVGRLTTGNPRAIADEDEVRGFFAPYAPWAGMAAQYLSRRPVSLRAPRPAGTRWSAGAPRRAAA